MKGQYRAGIFFALIALPLSPFSAFSKSSGQPAESAVQQEKATSVRQQSPGLNPDGVYLIRKGDTLYGIARVFNTTPEALKSANKLRSTRLQIGQELRIPVSGKSVAGTADSSVTESRSLPESSSVAPRTVLPEELDTLPNDDTYVVRKGDSLHRIARIYKTTPRALMSTNGMQGTRLQIGQELRIPVSRTAPAKAVERVVEKSPSLPESQPIPAVDAETGEPDPAEGAEPRRLQIVKAGFEMVGVRYRYGGNSEKSGFDCSGLVKSLFSKVDIDLPRSSREQFRQGAKVDRDELEVGDLVFFSSGGKQPNHVGIYVGDNKFLHAARKARQVIVSDLNKLWYNVRYLGARRIADLWNDEPDPETHNN